jgi:hypothetical protein
MISPRPFLLSSDRTFHWTLPPLLSFDYFSFQKDGAGSMLLIGMHLAESMPWLCARHPLCFPQEPGWIDQECKRILGKRFRPHERPSLKEEKHLDPIAQVLETVTQTAHVFDEEPRFVPQVKVPGKLLPRKLTARAELVIQDREFCFHSRNFSELSQCLHAELTLVFALSRFLSELPEPPETIASFRLETTLKPCKMCAAFLHAMKPKCQSFHVSYVEDDPGRLATDTLLDRFGYQSQF